jgi:hypothetical protein
MMQAIFSMSEISVAASKKICRLPEKIGIIGHGLHGPHRKTRIKTWTELGKKKIFFGHQSVGYNIVDGLKIEMRDHPQIAMNISETDNPSSFSGPIFAHFSVGKNQAPASKCASFRSIMEGGIGNRADFAFFKFCYVDVAVGSRPEEIVGLYKSALSDLRKEFPQTIFIDFIIPLTR